MSDLNKLKQIRRQNPNNDDFAEAVDVYLKENKTCCDDPNNIVPFEDLDSHPYGMDVRGTRCKNCGKLIDFEIDK